MIRIDEFTGRNVAILGLGRTGLATAQALVAGGANLFVWDDNEPMREHAQQAGLNLSDLSQRDMSDLAALIISPGIAHSLPKPHHVVKLARACEVPVFGDMELFAHQIASLKPDNRPKIIGITGTNGKSTTTALVTHILRSAGFDAHAGGNIGRAVLDLPALKAGRVYVLELSSYQLELTRALRCDVACLLNLSPDHLLRHGDMEGYMAAKVRIFDNQKTTDLAICGVDDEHTSAYLSELATRAAPLCPISASTCLSRGVFVLDAKLIDATGASHRQVTDLSQAIGLQGRHNWQNAAAAFAIARHFDVPEQEIAKAFETFTGLSHRMEPLGQLGNVRFINDSKATNGQAAARALSSFSDIYWIAGGQAKEDGLQPVLPFTDRIRKAYLIGEAQKPFASTLNGHCEVKLCEQLDKAFAAAFADAKQAADCDPVVLLSPACASFDQFASFEERGEAFRLLWQNAAGDL